MVVKVQCFFGNMYSPLIYFATNFGHMKQVKVEAQRMEELQAESFYETGELGN